MDISLAKLPWYAQVGAFVVLATGGVMAFHTYYEVPVQADIAGRETQLVSLRGDVSKALATAQQVPDFRAEVDDLEKRLDGLRAVLPDEKDAADLLRRMQTEALGAHLIIKSFKPAPTVTKELHAEWPIELELEGTYHNLAVFFDRLGKSTRLVSISGLEVRGKDNPEPNATITARCVATTFVLLVPPAAPSEAPQPPAAKKAA
jgi:type IV pilus assembly protein PilO